MNAQNRIYGSMWPTNLNNVNIQIPKIAYNPINLVTFVVFRNHNYTFVDDIEAYIRINDLNGKQSVFFFLNEFSFIVSIKNYNIRAIEIQFPYIDK